MVMKFAAFSRSRVQDCRRVESGDLAGEVVFPGGLPLDFRGDGIGGEDAVVAGVGRARGAVLRALPKETQGGKGRRAGGQAGHPGSIEARSLRSKRAVTSGLRLRSWIKNPYAKIASGRSADTVTFGRSTTLLIRRSTATLQIA